LRSRGSLPLVGFLGSRRPSGRVCPTSACCHARIRRVGRGWRPGPML
jgi:hypothetical protein